MAITAYRGRVEINCQADICCEDAARENATVHCVVCDFSGIRIIDLDDKIIKDVPAEKIKPAKRAKQKED